MNQPLKKVSLYLWEYLKEFRWFFYIIVLGLVVMAGVLWVCESRADLTGELRLSPSSDSGSGSVSGAGTSVPVVPPLPRATAKAGEIGRQIQDIRQQLRDLSQGLARTDQELSNQFGMETVRIKALDDKLEALMIYWKQVDDSRRAGGMSSLYYTWIAMLGLGDFGAQSVGGKVVVAVAGLWGVLAFGMLTALLVAAVKRYYTDDNDRS